MKLMFQSHQGSIFKGVDDLGRWHRWDVPENHNTVWHKPWARNPNHRERSVDGIVLVQLQHTRFCTLFKKNVTLSAHQICNTIYRFWALGVEVRQMFLSRSQQEDVNKWRQTLCNGQSPTINKISKIKSVTSSVYSPQRIKV